MTGRDLLICRCEEVSLSEILEAIKEGARTIDEIKRRTRAGMGLCQGKTCRRLIAQILARETGQPIKDILPSTFRPPVRPIQLGVLVSTEEASHAREIR
ncbi:(2Fe-2S)-binding protein [Candidatus Poribacteria bacterium]|nr:(2Fe-2S)-binding protein [Candidatus Poribacteria bacterium]